MELRHEFTISRPPAEIFDLLLDLKQVSTCMPGATLTSHNGDDWHGQVSLKVGPKLLACEGIVTKANVDREQFCAVLDATGRELNGRGEATARITAKVTPQDGQSVVTVLSQVHSTAKGAQYGGSTIHEAAQRVIDQFARNLEARLLADENIPGSRSPEMRSRSAVTPRDDSLDNSAVVVRPALTRALPCLACLAAGGLLGYLAGLRRNHRNSSQLVS